MTTLFGVLLLVGGFTVLAVVRPWQSDDRGEPDPPAGRGSPRTRPRPGPRRTAPPTATSARADRAAAASALAEPAAETSRAATSGTAASGTAASSKVASGTATRPASRPRPRSLATGPAAASPTDSAAEGSPGPAKADASSSDVSQPATGTPAPVVALKPRPAARRAEPQPGDASSRHHRVETIQRGRRVSAATAGGTEIVLPEWLGPMSMTDADPVPARARHAG
ncbi:hypothetical protein [Catellatospora methionotrophica]|uniref:hypothetical protein n=1 Tax=Catellatospora methionotrophica TaxID=121620 RepID=UPI00140E77F7|nr:hypothetical protein [Catellatospora methionotrophica]